MLFYFTSNSIFTNVDGVCGRMGCGESTSKWLIKYYFQIRYISTLRMISSIFSSYILENEVPERPDQISLGKIEEEMMKAFCCHPGKVSFRDQKLGLNLSCAWWIFQNWRIFRFWGVYKSRKMFAYRQIDPEHRSELSGKLQQNLKNFKQIQETHRTKYWNKSGVFLVIYITFWFKIRWIALLIFCSRLVQ